MNVSVKMKPTIEMVFEAWDRIMTKHDVVLSVLDLEVISHFRKTLQQASIVASIVVAFDEYNGAIQLLEHVDCGRHITPEHITKNIDGIARIDRSVPASNEFGIVLENRLEGAIVEV
jgi:hypothetical protein